MAMAIASSSSSRSDGIAVPPPTYSLKELP
jgi:hypothetical protein